MALVLADRVEQVTRTTGLGDLTLGETLRGRQSFQAVTNNGDTVYYVLEDAEGMEWEIGEGTVVHGTETTLQRTTIRQSSNADNKISLSAGTHRVFLVADAAYLTDLTTSAELAQAIADHEAKADPHPQYTTTAEASAAAPVQTVNGETGTVLLDAADVGATPASHVGTGGAQHANATTSVSGFMSGADKTKLDTVETSAKDDQSAAEVPYSNTTSGLAATQVQAAIDEVDGQVDTNTSNIATNTTEINKRTIYVGSVAEGISGMTVIDGRAYTAIGWHAGSAALSNPASISLVGAASVAKSQHGISGWSPTVPPVSAQPGATLSERVNNYIAGNGETDAAGTGIFVMDFGQKPVNVLWYGAIADGSYDNAPSFNAAFVYQNSSPSGFSETPTYSGAHGARIPVYIPYGKYNIEGQVSVGTAYPRILSDHALIVNNSGTLAVAAFTMPQGWQVYVEGLMFGGMDIAVNVQNANIDEGKITFKDCYFQGHNIGVTLEAQSSKSTFDDCKFTGNKKSILATASDGTVILGGWCSAGVMDEAGQGQFEFNGAVLKIDSMLMVPSDPAFNAAGVAWVKMSGAGGTLTAYEARFGGEFGGMPAVNWHIEGEGANTGSPKGIKLLYCETYSPNGQPTVNLFKLPNFVVLEKNRYNGNHKSIKFTESGTTTLDSEITRIGTNLKISLNDINTVGANQNRFDAAIGGRLLPYSGTNTKCPGLETGINATTPKAIKFSGNLTSNNNFLLTNLKHSYRINFSAVDDSSLSESAYAVTKAGIFEIFGTGTPKQPVLFDDAGVLKVKLLSSATLTDVGYTIENTTGDYL